MKNLKKIFNFLIFIFFIYSIPSFSSYELDRKYSLESIGALKSWDNVDDVFSDYIESAYKEFFIKQTRFRYVDTSILSKILEGSKIPYAELIENKKILERLVRTGKIESLLRTKIIKENERYRVQIEWIYSATLELLGNIEFYYTPRGVGLDLGGESLKIQIKENLTLLLKQIPYLGHLTGVDSPSVTLNLGYNSGFKVGDQLEVSTLEEVRVHPLLNKLVDWRFKKIGRIEIIEIQERMSFGKIIQKEMNVDFDRYQKITKIFPHDDRAYTLHSTSQSPLSARPRPTVSEKTIEYSGSHTQDLNSSSPHSEEHNIRLGYIGGGFALGSTSRKLRGENISNEGTGLYFAPIVQGELWITREFFGSLSLSPHFYKHTHTNLISGLEEPAASSNGSGFHFEFSGGYYFHFTENFFGPKAFFKLGYRAYSFNLPDSEIYRTSATSYKSLFIGIGGDIPIKDNYGAFLDLNFGLIKSVSDTLFLNQSPASTSDIQVFAGGYYWIKPRVCLRGGIQFNVKGADYSGENSVQHSVTSFTLKGLYYF